MAQFNSRLVGHVSPQTLLIWGGATIALGGTLLLVVVLTGIGLAGILPSLFIMTASLGLIMPNSTTLALANTQTAGSASGLLGVLQLVIGAIAAPLVGIAGSSSAIPMAAAIATFGIATLLTTIIVSRPAQLQTQRA